MIIKEIFYAVECNCCGKIYNDDDDHSFFWDKYDAVECACADDWINEKDKHYCPDCIAPDEDGSPAEIVEHFKNQE